jgi:uncharacterized protein (DUF427 family)
MLAHMRPSRILPGPGQESVWDYPRPPAVESVPQRVRVVLAGVTIADSTRALRVLETSHPPNYYLPPDDVDRQRLEMAPGTSWCEFKGGARYWTVQVGDRVEASVAWDYPEPSAGYEALASHLAFYAAPMDECRVGDELATPQPGGFYGGWVTSGVVGPFKGIPGSMGW